MIFRFILSLSTVPFDCEFYSYVSEVLSLNLYRPPGFMAFWWWWWFDKRNEMKFLHFLSGFGEKRSMGSLMCSNGQKSSPTLKVDFWRVIFLTILRCSQHWVSAGPSINWVWLIFYDFSRTLNEKAQNARDPLRRPLAQFIDDTF